MTYGSDYDFFLKVNAELSNEDKIHRLKSYSVRDMLTLLRNIEESPRGYDGEIIKGVYSCLYDKGIMCI